MRNRVAAELGYTSYFHLQVADYGMTVAEMMALMDKTVADMRPIYSKLHEYARKQWADRYKQPIPEKLPAHWTSNRWGQEWPGLVDESKSPEWIVKQAERFYTSLGMQPLLKSFWEKSDLYELPAGSKRRKNTHTTAWNIDLEQDVRSLMSVTPNFRWFGTTHHELGHVYYYLAYNRPEVPAVLREGANRACHEAIGDLIAIAAHQLPYLRDIGIPPKDAKIDDRQWLLNEALDSAVVFLPWGAGVMSHFEHELYEKKLPAGPVQQALVGTRGSISGDGPADAARRGVLRRLHQDSHHRRCRPILRLRNGLPSSRIRITAITMGTRKWVSGSATF